MTLIMGKSTPSTFNRPIYGLLGSYTLSQAITLPYVLAALPIDRAIDELRIAEQVPPSLANQWALNELYQREVDRTRVKNEIVKGYLADPTKLKFFNALTIILMPKKAYVIDGDPFPIDPSGGPRIPFDSNDSEDAAWAAPEAARYNLLGVQYVAYGDQARLRWDFEIVDAVVVDGQHRLVALQEFYDENRQKSFTDRERLTKIPVLFILLSGNAGFEHSRTGGTEIRSIARELFTDLNKNAKAVDQARQLILDDWSITARAVRTLLTAETASDEEGLLPLTLVRWQDETNRFDSSYFLNSVVHLETLVNLTLRLTPPIDPMDEAQVRKYIQSVDAALGGGQPIRNGDQTLEEHYSQEYLSRGDTPEPERPFSRLPPAYLEIALDGFRKYHKTWLIKVLTEFRPYANLLAYARENDLIRGVFGQFQAQTKRHQRVIRDERLESDPEFFQREIQAHIDAIELLKGPSANAEWAFKTIFQKALARLARVVAFEHGNDSQRLGSIDDLLSFLNGVYDRGSLRVGAPLPSDTTYGLWAFIAVNPLGGKIKVNRAVENRLTATLGLWYYGHRARGAAQLNGEECPSAAQLVRLFQQKGQKVFWPNCNDYYEDLAGCFNSPVFFGTPLSETAQKKRIRKRLVTIMETGLGDETSIAESDEDYDSASA